MDRVVDRVLLVDQEVAQGVLHLAVDPVVQDRGVDRGVLVDRGVDQGVSKKNLSKPFSLDGG